MVPFPSYDDMIKGKADVLGWIKKMYITRYVKVSKYRKQNTKFSHTQKKQRNFVVQTQIKALDDLN